MRPNMALVKAWAKKYEISGKIEESERKNKKLKVMHEGRWIHFGHPDYEDFTIHRDPVRQRAYCKRAGGIRGKDGRYTGNDPESPNYYAMRLLWDCVP